MLRREPQRVVIGAGLAAGERVSISPLPGVVDGMSVRVADEPPPDRHAAAQGNTP